MTIIRKLMMTLFFSYSLIAVHSLDLRAQTLILDKEGKTLYLYPISNDPKFINIEVLNVSAEEMDKYQIRYRYLDGVKNPFLLAEVETTVDKITKQESDYGSVLNFKIPKRNKKFLVYNLWVQTYTKLEPEEISKLDAELDELKKEIEKIDRDKNNLAEIKAISEKRKRLAKDKIDKKKDINTRINEINKKIDLKKKEIEVYQKLVVEKSVPEIKRIFKELDILNKKKNTLEKQNRTFTETIGKEIKALDNQKKKIIQEYENQHQYSKMKARFTEVEKIINNQSFAIYKVKKLGGLVMGKNRKSIYYDTIQNQGQGGLHLKRLGDYPVLTQDDYIYAVIINRVDKYHSAPFHLVVKSAKGEFVHSTPVRPSITATLQEGYDERKFKDLKAAYRDEILPFGRTFPGDYILTVTISTYTETITVDKKTTGSSKSEVKTVEKKLVNLIDSVQYPQIRSLYRYNLTTGFIYSTLRNSEFVKVKVQNDDPNTTASESLYRIDENKENNKILPIIAFTIYLKRKDIHKPPTLGEMLIPHPTVALKLNNPDPTEHFFFGFSHEFLFRNTQLFWGFHLGEINELVIRNEVDEERDPTEPKTKKRHKLRFMIGLKFNVDFLTKLIK